jgi:flagellar biogenesis protein FliO
MSASLALLAAAAAPLAYGEGPTVPWARIVLSLLFCLAVAVGAIAVIRRRAGQPPLGALTALLLPRGGHAVPRQLELLERLALTPTSQVCLVRCGDRRLVVLVSPGGAQVVDGPAPGDTPENTP